MSSCEHAQCGVLIPDSRDIQNVHIGPIQIAILPHSNHWTGSAQLERPRYIKNREQNMVSGHRSMGDQPSVYCLYIYAAFYKKVVHVFWDKAKLDLYVYIKLV